MSLQCESCLGLHPKLDFGVQEASTQADKAVKSGKGYWEIWACHPPTRALSSWSSPSTLCSHQPSCSSPTTAWAQLFLLLTCSSWIWSTSRSQFPFSSLGSSWELYLSKRQLVGGRHRLWLEDAGSQWKIQKRAVWVPGHSNLYFWVRQCILVMFLQAHHLIAGPVLCSRVHIPAEVCLWDAGPWDHWDTCAGAMLPTGSQLRHDSKMTHKTNAEYLPMLNTASTYI